MATLIGPPVVYMTKQRRMLRAPNRLLIVFVCVWAISLIPASVETGRLREVASDWFALSSQRRMSVWICESGLYRLVVARSEYVTSRRNETVPLVPNERVGRRLADLGLTDTEIAVVEGLASDGLTGQCEVASCGQPLGVATSIPIVLTMAWRSEYVRQSPTSGMATREVNEFGGWLNPHALPVQGHHGIQIWSPHASSASPVTYRATRLRPIVPIFPHPLIIIPTGVVVLLISTGHLLWKWCLRRRRRHAGQCLGCGYPIVPEAQRCPECGGVLASGAR
ncbi:MAG: hypothetical protein ACTS3F_02020 [Phycisphaerales bacterium]